MNKTILIGFLVSLIVGCAGVPQVEKGEAQTHLAHILSANPNTPDNQGLIALALDAARQAQSEASLALEVPSDLGALKIAAKKIREIVDPDKSLYGVIRATSEIVQHLRLASKSSDATTAVRSEVVRLGRSAKSVLRRARLISRLASDIGTITEADQAVLKLKKIRKLAVELESGLDSDGDGLVTWRRGEGGLNLMQDRLRSVYISN